VRRMWCLWRTLLPVLLAHLAAGSRAAADSLRVALLGLVPPAPSALWRRCRQPAAAARAAGPRPVPTPTCTPRAALPGGHRPRVAARLPEREAQPGRAHHAGGAAAAVLGHCGGALPDEQAAVHHAGGAARLPAGERAGGPLGARWGPLEAAGAAGVAGAAGAAGAASCQLPAASCQLPAASCSVAPSRSLTAPATIPATPQDPSLVLLGFSWDSSDEGKMQRTFGFGRSTFARFLDLQHVAASLGYSRWAATRRAAVATEQASRAPAAPGLVRARAAAGACPCGAQAASHARAAAAVDDRAELLRRCAPAQVRSG
jgi:hypothetical protein